MTYSGDTYYQIDNSAYEESNCVLATGTGLEDTASLGYYRTPANKLRVISGDTSGGVSYDQMIDTVKSATNSQVVLTRLYYAPDSIIDDFKEAPKEFGISIDCSVTINTDFHTGNYTGGHTVRVKARGFRTYTWTDSSGVKHSRPEVLVADPGRGTSSNKLPPRWWPLSLLMKAAHARTGNNGVHVVYTRDLAGVKRTATASGQIRAKADISSADVGDTHAGTAYTVIDTVKGGKWSVNGHTGYGWNQIGTGKYIAGGLLH